MLWGWPPFNGPNDNEIIKKVKAGKYSIEEEEGQKISAGAKDLVKKLLTYQSYERISAADALKHPWI